MDNLFQSLTSSETLAFIETKVLPWIAALLMSVTYSVPMIANLKKKVTTYIEQIKANFELLKDSTDKSSEESKNAITEFKKRSDELFYDFKKEVQALPLTEIKGVLVATLQNVQSADNAIVGFQNCFLTMFDFLYMQAMSSPIYSDEVKTQMKLTYEKAKYDLSQADLSESMKAVKEAIAKVDKENGNVEIEIEESTD